MKHLCWRGVAAPRASPSACARIPAAGRSRARKLVRTSEVGRRYGVNRGTLAWPAADGESRELGKDAAYRMQAVQALLSR